MTGAERIEFVARMIVPYAFMFLLLLLSIVAAPYPLNIFMDAPLVLMPLYYWSIYRPMMVPSWLCFVVGFLIDILSGFPLGLNALLFVVMRMFVVNQRHFFMAQGYFSLWLGFVVLSASVYGVQWVGMSIRSFQFLPFGGLYDAIILGALSFPVILAFIRLTHKIL